MPRPKSIIPSIPQKFYLTQENAAALALACHSEILGKAVHGLASSLVNEALSDFFSPSRKEYLSWKAQKLQPESPSSEPKPKSES